MSWLSQARILFGRLAVVLYCLEYRINRKGKDVSALNTSAYFVRARNQIPRYYSTVDYSDWRD